MVHIQNLTVTPEIKQTLLQLRATDKLRLNGYIWLLREAGWTLQSIADVLGVSRERVRQFHAKAYVFTDLPSVSVPQKAKKNEKETPPKHRPLRIQSEAAEELRAMHAIARTVNGGTLSNDPRRQVSVNFTACLARLVEQGYSIKEISRVLGIHRFAVTSRLARHGYREPCPSLVSEQYKGLGTYEIA